MGREIERKFLVNPALWKPPGTGDRLCQGYLPTTGLCTVRVRIAGEKAYLTLKGPAVGLVRPEFEYPIPKADADTILQDLCDKPTIEKIRYRVLFQDRIWEVDEFLGANLGLLLAEIELQHADQPFASPPWLGQEVSDDARYLNASLAKHPYREWGLSDSVLEES